MRVTLNGFRWLAAFVAVHREPKGSAAFAGRASLTGLNGGDGTAGYEHALCRLFLGLIRFLNALGVLVRSGCHTQSNKLPRYLTCLFAKAQATISTCLFLFSRGSLYKVTSGLKKTAA